jgi:hypothetical protein
MRRALVGSLVAAMLLATAPLADARTPNWARDGGWLTKRHAQQGATVFAKEIGPLLDRPEVANRVTVHVAAASKCHRRDHATVLCWFGAQLVSQPIWLTGFMRVHLQRNGLQGYRLPWDPQKVGLGWY